MKNYLLIGALIFIAVVVLLTWKFQTSQPTSSINTPTATSQPQSSTSPNAVTFANPKKSAHYETNTPTHGAVLAGVPANVVIDFNFDLAKPSEIKILKEGQDFGVGETTIDANKLALRRKMNMDSPNGLYTVEYNACWPDGSCHDGHFQFAIDKSQAERFDNQTSKNEVIIKLSQLKFNPQNIKVTKGAKVTWINDDDVEHYINTDSHPAHTYYPAQNSKALKKGDSFSLTFAEPGIYPYHCSAHADSMIGSLLVE